MIAEVERLGAEIETLDLEGLRDVWRERYGAPPPLRSAPIMRQLLAWRVQAQALGGLDAETRKITASIDTTYQVGKQREAQLQGALAAQKARVLELNKQRDELNVLRRDIESAQRAFEIVSQEWRGPHLLSLMRKVSVPVPVPASEPPAA